MKNYISQLNGKEQNVYMCFDNIFNLPSFAYKKNYV